MRIFTFLATDPECPVQAVARIWLGKAGWHPVIMGSVNAASAAQKAQEFWDAEVAKAKEVADKKAAKALKKAAPPLLTPAEKEPVQAAVGVEDPGDVV